MENVGKLWVLYTHRKLAYAATFKEIDIDGHAYFYGCECGSMMKITEDAFLCREAITCVSCGAVQTATWEWIREVIDLPNA